MNFFASIVKGLTEALTVTNKKLIGAKVHKVEVPELNRKTPPQKVSKEPPSGS